MLDRAAVMAESPSTARSTSRETPGSRDSGGRARRVRLRITGVVQGVGFRPFTHNLAERLGLGGSVRNTTAGVEIEAEGSDAAIDSFLRAVSQGPAMARVERVEVLDVPARGNSRFRVEESATTTEGAGLISPDLATCPKCLRELDSSRDRRHRYPFINCTHCGPRFTIVDAVPYDRERTTMRGFTLCASCAQEYADPADRRYHAEATACSACGPHVALLDRSGAVLAERGRAIDEARRRLAAGQIVAVKGLGGFHLACDAACGEAVVRLRRLKGRPARPLAVMCRNMAVARGYCAISAAEARHLVTPKRPILLVPRRLEPAGRLPKLSEAVAPKQRNLGLMLPYTPLHHLLLRPPGPACLVMTSGNRSEEPIVSDNAEALRVLGPFSDALLVHDRTIRSRCDDSVGYVLDGTLALVRRSRGFVPLPVDLGFEIRPTLALGALLSNVFAIGSGRRVFLSQHIGDVEGQQTVAFLGESIDWFRRWLKLDPEIVAHDMHPDLLTTHLARELEGGRRRVAVQHHHAHLVSAMIAAQAGGTVQGLVCDGTGWGPDGTIWGGEILVGSGSGYQRAGHLRPLPLPGGEASIRWPIRLAAAYLHAMVPDSADAELDLWRRLKSEEAAAVRRMVDRGFNTLLTSSAGRLFDAVSALLGVCDRATYEGQAAIELEQAALEGHASRGPALRLDVLPGDEGIIVDPTPLFAKLVDALAGRACVGDLAAGFHRALADAFARSCAIVRERGGPETVVLAGGVFQNRLLTGLIDRALKKNGLVPVLPGPIPVGDGGLALGQLVIANQAPDAGAAAAE
jgi:hydrogenase maturation protein HypF